MTNFVNPLDKAPIIPQDYANHIVYGFFAWFVFTLVANWFSPGHPGFALLHGYYALFALSAGKKIVDYFWEHETWQVCLKKTIVTMTVPAMTMLMLYLILIQ